MTSREQPDMFVQQVCAAFELEPWEIGIGRPPRRARIRMRCYRWVYPYRFYCQRRFRRLDADG